MNFHDADKAIEELQRALASRRAEAIADAAVFNIWPLYSWHNEALVEAVKSLPSSVLDRRPILKIVHPLTPVLARTGRPFKPLVTAESARGMSVGELDMTTLVQMVGFRFSGDVSAALIYARRLEDRLHQTRLESRERADGPLWFYHFHIGSTYLAAGDLTRALLQFATARQLGRLSHQPDAERLVLGRIALAHALRGSLNKAEQALNELTAHPDPTPVHRDACVMTARTTAALIAVDQMSSSADDLLAGLEPYDSVLLTWGGGLLARTRWLIAMHRAEEALEVIRLTRDAHPVQHGAFANDVINSASIEALTNLGEMTAARQIADAHGQSGPLTRLAVIRLALVESRLDVAGKQITRLRQEENLSPGQRAELVLLSAWLEMQRTDTLDAETARQVWRLTSRSENRRILAGVPAALIDLVRPQLSAEDSVILEAGVSGLSHVEIQPRPKLTQGELRVLNALSSHDTTANIATSFHVSPNTIKSQLKSMYRKLGCSTREEALLIAARSHLLTPELS